MIHRTVLWPQRYLSYLDRLLDAGLKSIAERRIEDLQNDELPDVMMELRIERPEPPMRDLPEGARLRLVKGSA